jgi:uncharacterized membrane protein
MFDYHHSWGMMLGMFVFWLLVLGGGAWLLSRLFPAMASGPDVDAGRGHEAMDPALEVVRQRYASGEITQAEYEELLRALA